MVPVCAEKVRAEGVSETAGAAVLVPVPVSATVCGDPVALSATESMAEKLAAKAGVKLIEIEQLAPAASELPQVFVCAKSEGFAPPTLTLLIVSVALPVFLSVAVCGALVVPVCAEKASVEGVRETPGAVLPAGEMVKFTPADVPPPGVGLVTVTGTVAAVAMSAAGITAVS